MGLTRDRAGRDGPHLYARFGTAASDALEARLAAMLSATWARVFTSGSAALDAAVSAALERAAGTETGPDLAITTDSYSGTRRYAEHVLAHLRGLRVVRLDLDGLAEELGSLRPRVVVLEAISNPFLARGPLAETCAAVHAYGGTVVVDATLAPPPNRFAGDLGADLVVHSATKYFSEQPTHLAGVVAGSSVHLEAGVADYRRMVGSILDEALCVRMQQALPAVPAKVESQCASASELATALRSAPGIAQLWATQRGPGGTGPGSTLVTIEVCNPAGEAAADVVGRVLGRTASSLDNTASFGGRTSTATFAGLLDRALAHRALLRISCGVGPMEHLSQTLVDAVADARQEGTLT